jgi:hypothetical protein
MTDTKSTLDALNKNAGKVVEIETYTPGTHREKARMLIDDVRFEKAIMALIIINAITLGLETSQTPLPS